MPLERRSAHVAFTVPDTQANTGSLHVKGFAMAGVFVPGGYTGGTTWTWQATNDGGTTWFAVIDEGGSAVTSTVAAGSACEVPPEVMAYDEVRATHTAVTRDESLGLQLKA